MKSIDIKDLDQLPGRRIDENDTFLFRCHSELSCFNQCCRNLNLFLTPYDVIRLKNKLEMTSGEFLDAHTHIVLRPVSHFPDVLLKMNENEEKTCPFLTACGCSVYHDRPDSCRTFPVEQGVVYEDGKSHMIHFFKPPDFCLGRNEKMEWTPSSWEKDQDAANHHKMTILWSGVKRYFDRGNMTGDPWGGEGDYGRKARTAFMATYNMDDFREFVFKSTFLKRFKVAQDIKRRAKKDDVVLMKLGFNWIKLFLFNIKSKSVSFKK